MDVMGLRLKLVKLTSEAALSSEVKSNFKTTCHAPF
jgi:hypothetical protein